MNVYQNVIIGTAVLATSIMLIFMLLVFRRYLSERADAKRDQIDRAITKSYLRRVAGYPYDNAKSWTKARRLSAIMRILPLLRGGERERLLQIVELDGVMGSILRRSHSVREAERVTAIRHLQRIRSEVCIGRLRELLARDPSPRVQLEAAFALAASESLPPPRETMRILGMLDRPPKRIDVALLRATAPHYREQMVLLLEGDLSRQWRAKIIDSLGWSGDMRVLPFLERSANDLDPEIRCAVLRASAKLNHPGAAELVLRALKDREDAVRIQAVNACATLGLKEATGTLLQMRHDEQLWVRLRVDQALRKLSTRSQEPAQLRAVG